MSNNARNPSNSNIDKDKKYKLPCYAIIPALSVVLLALGYKLLLQAEPVAASSNVNVPGCVCSTHDAIASYFNSTMITSSNTVWFNSSVTVQGADNGTLLRFSSSTITFMANSVQYTLQVPGSLIQFSSAVTQAATTFDLVAGEWSTVVPLQYTGKIFLSGYTFRVTTGGLPGGINPVTWSGDFATNRSGIATSWQWGASKYGVFPDGNADPSLYNTIGVKPIDWSTLNLYHNTDIAGTPENYKSFYAHYLTNYTSGGSKYTGYWGTTNYPYPCTGGSLGDYVWYDVNYNGRQDANEEGFQGVVLDLFGKDGRRITGTQTDVNGKYLFDALPLEATYIVRISTTSYMPAGSVLYTFTQTLLNVAPVGMISRASVTATYGGFGYAITTTLTSYNPQDLALDYGFMQMDFGDLPEMSVNGFGSYGTLLASDGARHVIGHLYLGANVDAEKDGKPTLLANCDNYDDGVVFYPPINWAVGASAALTVTVHGTTGYLVGWIDWNHDGNFLEANEKIDFGHLVSGTTVLSLAPPITPSLELFERFRLYDGTPSIISPKGLAVNGEVEDYQYVVPTKPTAVDIIYFQVKSVTGHEVNLGWATAQELGTVGFTIYRADSAERSHAVPVHYEPTAAPGGVIGSEYSYVDTIPTSGQWWYWLVEVGGWGNQSNAGAASTSVIVGTTLPNVLYVPVLRR